MGRRCMIVVVGLSLALEAGCGSMMMAQQAQQGQPIWLLRRLDWTVYHPSHRVALATYDTLKAELAEVKVGHVELTEDDRYNTPDGKMPKPGEVDIPEDYPAFWMDGINTSSPTIVNIRYCDFEGKTKDGKRVDVVVRLEIVGTSEQHTVVSVQVGRKGDEKLTKALIDKISDRVTDPKPKVQPGSPEERTALNAAFGPQPGKDERKFLASGEIRIKKN